MDGVMQVVAHLAEHLTVAERMPEDIPDRMSEDMPEGM